MTDKVITEMTNPEQIKQVAAKLHLTLDNPQSVRNQLKQINEAQKELRQFKQEVVVKIREVNQKSNKFGLDEAAAIGLSIFGKHRLARQVNRQGNRIENKQKQRAKQPLIKMRDLIDNYIFEADRLKIMGKEYLEKN